MQSPFPRRNEPAAEIIHMFRDDFLAGGDLLTPQGERLLRDRLQRIDIVKKNAFHLVHIGRDVPRHRDINDEKRPIEPIAQKGLEVFAA